MNSSSNTEKAVAFHSIQIPLGENAEENIIVHRFIGNGTGPAVYIQAGIHGNEHPGILVFGLALSVALMAFGAVYIARLLEKYHWIAYIGLLVILQVSLVMIWEGSQQVLQIALA